MENTSSSAFQFMIHKSNLNTQDTINFIFSFLKLD